jgi:hypothetical protein
MASRSSSGERGARATVHHTGRLRRLAILQWRIFAATKLTARLLSLKAHGHCRKIRIPCLPVCPDGIATEHYAAARAGRRHWILFGSSARHVLVAWRESTRVARFLRGVLQRGVERREAIYSGRAWCVARGMSAFVLLLVTLRAWQSLVRVNREERRGQRLVATAEAWWRASHLARHFVAWKHLQRRGAAARSLLCRSYAHRARACLAAWRGWLQQRRAKAQLHEAAADVWKLHRRATIWKRWRRRTASRRVALLSEFLWLKSGFHRIAAHGRALLLLVAAPHTRESEAALDDVEAVDGSDHEADDEADEERPRRLAVVHSALRLVALWCRSTVAHAVNRWRRYVHQCAVHALRHALIYSRLASLQRQQRSRPRAVDLASIWRRWRAYVLSKLQERLASRSSRRLHERRYLPPDPPLAEACERTMREAVRVCVCA